MKLYYAQGEEWQRNVRAALSSILWGSIAVGAFIYMGESIIVQVLCLLIVVWQIAYFLQMPDRVYIEIYNDILLIHQGVPLIRKRLDIRGIKRTGVFKETLCLYHDRGKETVIYLNRLTIGDQSRLLDHLEKELYGTKHAGI